MAIVGPTGSGKSKLAIHLAKQWGGQIISADSVQVYRGLDIGTAKPTLEERKLVPHHLVDILDPEEIYSAAQFRIQASAIIRDLRTSGIPVFVVGGTGLYLKTLCRGIFQGPSANPDFRRSMQEAAREQGIEKLHAELEKIDPVAASKIHPRDTSRIIRALEVYHESGMSISSFQKSHGFADQDFDVLKIGLFFPRDDLYRRIGARVDRMLEQGWIQEVQVLLRQGVNPCAKSLQSLGYKRIVSFLLGRGNFEELAALIKRDTRRYAKRQLTWFRADPEILWFRGDLEEIGSIQKKVEEFWSQSQWIC